MMSTDGPRPRLEEVAKMIFGGGGGNYILREDVNYPHE